MFRHAALFSASFVITALLLSPAAAFEGPLQVRNQFPLFMHIDAPYLESAYPEDSFSASLSHSSVFMLKQSARWAVELDLELTELNLRYKKPLPDFFEVGVDVPVMRLTAGFMDGGLDGYHSTFNFPDYGRSTRPKNEFLYEVRKDGVVVIQGAKDKTGIGDVRLSLKKIVLKNDPAVSVMGTVELPTGDARTGYGSGSVDWGLAVLADKTFDERLRMYGNIGAVFPGAFKGYETIPLKNYYYGGVGAEAALWRHVSLLGQVFVQTSPFPAMNISVVDGAAVLLVLGGRHSSGNHHFELSLTEDLNTTGAPDFILNFTYKLKLQ
jgi:hypothetical protein